MTQYNFRTRLEPNLFSGHFDKAGTVLASRYAHNSCARMTRGSKTGYTTSLTSVTSPNSWMSYRAYSTGFWHDFFRGFSFLSIFRLAGKTSIIRVQETYPRPALLRNWISSGINVLWPAACVLTPTTCTSASTACWATSLGVCRTVKLTPNRKTDQNRIQVQN